MASYHPSITAEMIDRSMSADPIPTARVDGREFLLIEDDDGKLIILMDNEALMPLAIRLGRETAILLVEDFISNLREECSADVKAEVKEFIIRPGSPFWQTAADIGKYLLLAELYPIRQPHGLVVYTNGVIFPEQFYTQFSPRYLKWIYRAINAELARYHYLQIEKAPLVEARKLTHEIEAMNRRLEVMGEDTTEYSALRWVNTQVKEALKDREQLEKNSSAMSQEQLQALYLSLKTHEERIREATEAPNINSHVTAERAQKRQRRENANTNSGLLKDFFESDAEYFRIIGVLKEHEYIKDSMTGPSPGTSLFKWVHCEEPNWMCEPVQLLRSLAKLGYLTTGKLPATDIRRISEKTFGVIFGETHSKQPEDPTQHEGWERRVRPVRN